MLIFLIKERAPRLTSLDKEQNDIQRAEVTWLRLGNEMVAQGGDFFGVILVCQILC